MAEDSPPRAAEHVRRLELVGRMTELNSRHLKSQSQRGGLEFEIARCEEAIDRGDQSEDFPAALDALRQELAVVDRSRLEIDLERARLEEELAALNRPPEDGG